MGGFHRRRGFKRGRRGPAGRLISAKILVTLVVDGVDHLLAKTHALSASISRSHAPFPTSGMFSCMHAPYAAICEGLSEGGDASRVGLERAVRSRERTRGARTGRAGRCAERAGRERLARTHLNAAPSRGGFETIGDPERRVGAGRRRGGCAHQTRALVRLTTPPSGSRTKKRRTVLLGACSLHLAHPRRQ